MEEAPRYRPLLYYVEQVKTCILTGLMCLNADPNERPTTRDIIEKLTEADVAPGIDLRDLVHAKLEILGTDTYVNVYKVTQENGTVRAFRRFTSEMTKDKVAYFKAEVAVLAKIRHPNLLQPIACFVEGDEKLIVTDYMPRGSLSAFLHGYS